MYRCRNPSPRFNIISRHPSIRRCIIREIEHGEECNCTEYQDAPEQPGYCAECYHRRKAHFVATPGAPTPSVGVKAILAKLVSGSTSKGKLALKAPPSASSSQKTVFSTLGAAERESNAGMRPSPKEAGTSKSAKVRRESHRCLPQV